MWRGSVILGLLLTVADPGLAAEVWRSKFDVDADGVIEFKDGNSAALIEGALNGKLAVHTKDNAADSASGDKGGRALGATLGGSSSFSALYIFNWSYTALWTLNDAPAYEFVGFLGSSAAYQNRQICGTLLKHWTTNRDNPDSHAMVQIAVRFNTVGASDEGELWGPVVDLGLRGAVMNPSAPPFKLAIGFDGGTHVLSIGLYDSINNQLGRMDTDLDTDVPGLLTYGGSAAEIGSLAVDYVGWSDWRFWGYGAGTEDRWQVDELAYFDTSTGAFDELTAPIGACCAGGGTCADTTFANCAGTWSGPGTSCASAVCTGACCHPDGTCSDTLPTACADKYHGVGTQCSTTGCPQVGACCLSDGTCQLTLPEECCGVFQGEGTTCTGASCAPPIGEVWKATFDADADGVVVVQEQNAALPKIGTAAEGRLQITNYDVVAPTVNKAGRPLGSTFGECDSFSALYQFRWTDLYQGNLVSGYGLFDMAGFIGSTASGGAFTRQNVTAVFTHWKDANGDYWVALAVGAGASGSWSYTLGPSINLGPNAINRDLQLVIGYDSATKVAVVQLFDAVGSLLGSQSANLGVKLGADVHTLAVDHLGWSDYQGVASLAGQDVPAVWSVDTLAFYDTPKGAYMAVNRLPGACCSTDGTCSEVLETTCSGTFQGVGSTCAGVTCPQPGACCLNDGTCALLTQEACAAQCGLFHGAGTSCTGTDCGVGWRATFADSFDGVLEFRDGNTDPEKNPVGSVTNGKLRVEVWDYNPTDPNTWWPDKSGRPLGMTIQPCRAFSGMYAFNWSALNDGATPATEFAGFLGDEPPYQSRQVCGAILRHWKAGSDYMVQLGIGFGSVGNTGFGELEGPEINLGPSATTALYRLAVGFDPSTNKLSVGLYGATGTLLGRMDPDLDIDVPGLQQYSTPASEIAALAVNYLGWMDYRTAGGNVATIWDVDELVLYGTASGAFEEAANPFRIPGDFDTNGMVNLEDVAIFVQCSAGPAVPVLTLPQCVKTDLDTDGDADQDDFGLLQRCFSGNAPADPACAD